MRLFAQIGWYFRREWRRYLGAVVLLIAIAILQLLPPKLVGIIVDGVTKDQMSNKVLMAWLGLMIGTAIVVYLLRYVWRVLLFGASYQLAVELRENFYRQLSRQNPAFYLRHRTGDLMARATNDVDRVVFAAGEGVLTLVDSLVMGLAVLIVMSTQNQLAIDPAFPDPDADHGDCHQILWRSAAPAFQVGAGCVLQPQRSGTGEHDQHPYDQGFWPGGSSV